MLQLRTLGSLDLLDSSGTSLDQILAQPKRSLLLAYIAASSPRGYKRRDVLVALFWPELDDERARRALRKALHFLRGSLGDAIIARGDEIGVDPALLSCDIDDFERAVAEGRREDALAIYRGDFLPGVFAKEAPDVERWVFDERLRLSAMATRMAWSLADEAAVTDPDSAVAWAARAATTSPGDEPTLRRRMQLLSGLGDKASALKLYEEFASALAREFDGAEPSHDTHALYLSLRDEQRSLDPPRRESPAATAIAIAEIESENRESPRSSREGWWQRRHWSLPASLAVACLVLTVVAIALWIRGPAQAAAPAADADGRRTIAVMPFTIRGDRVDYLREGMVDLLSISLEGAGEIKTIDPGAIFSELAHEPERVNELERARAAAEHFGAGHFILGTIVNAQGRLEARVSLFDTRSKSEEPAAVATGSSDETALGTLVDDLTREIVAGVFNSRDTRLNQLAAKTTNSLIALKSYLRGAKALREGKYADATDAFQTAVKADTGFALAYYGLSMALGWASDGADHFATVAAEQAVRHSKGLSPHDSLLLVAHYHAWRGYGVDAEQDYKRLIAQSPSDVDAWYELSDVIFHSGVMSGHAMRDSRDGFARVANIEPLRVSALTHLARIAAIEHDTVALDSLARQANLTSPGDPRVKEIVTLRTFVSGDSLARVTTLRALAALGDEEIWRTAREIANYAGAFRSAEEIAMLLTVPTRASAVRALGWTLIAQIRVAAGRPAAARAAIAEASLFDPTQAAVVRATIAATSSFGVSHAELAAARSDLERWGRPYFPLGLVNDGAVGGGWAALRKPLLDAAIRIRMNDAPAPPPTDTLIAAFLRGTQMAVQVLKDSTSQLAVAQARLAYLDQSWSRLQNIAIASIEPVVRLARSRLLEQVGRNDESLRWYATFPAYGRDDFVFRGVATLEHARLQKRMGRTEPARASYNEVAWLWRDAEPGVRATALDVFTGPR